MTSKIVTTDEIGPANLAGSEFLLVLESGVLRANGDAVTVASGGNTIDNLGLIFSLSHAIYLANGTNAGAVVRNSGTIIGQIDGIRTDEALSLSVVNTGEIHGGGAGIAIVEPAGGVAFASIRNEGTITGNTGVSIFDVALGPILNTGQILGVSAGIRLGGDLGPTAQVTNAGTISGEEAISAIGATSVLTVVNDGLLAGKVLLGSAGDMLDSSLGRIAGLVDGGDGADTLIGGTGAVTMLGGLGDDFVSGGGGDDSLLGGDGLDTITGGAGRDMLLGLAGIDDLDGGDGNDVLRGGAGADFLDGGLGRDLLDYALSVAVNVNLGTGEASGGDATGDVITGFENLAGGAGSDILTGDAAANILYGRGGNDLLTGGGGNDLLVGDIGKDTLDGGLGADVLRGGIGADVFRLATTTSSPNLAGQRDRIFDVVRAEADRVDLSLIDADAALAGDQAFAFVGGAAFTAAGQVRAVLSGGSYLVTGNTDANLATAEFALVMTTATAPIAADFIL